MNELTGGLRNAIERGESLETAKQSFINSGYKQEEVEKASEELFQVFPGLQQKIPKQAETLQAGSFNQQQMQASEVSQQINQQKTIQPPISPGAMQNKNYPALPTELPAISQTQGQEKKGIAKKWIIIMIIFSLLVVVGAAIIGIFWDKIYSYVA